MGDILMSILGGGATGLLGTLFSQVAGFIDKERERKFILEKHKLDAEIRSKETESATAIAEVNAMTQSVSASYVHDSSFGQTSMWVANIRSLVRPCLTVLLWILVGIIWFSTSPEEKELRSQIVNNIVYCAVAATIWWYGIRDMRKR